MGKLDLVLVDDFFCNFHPEIAIFFNFELNSQHVSYLSYVLKIAMLKSKKTNSPVVVECKNSWEIRVNVYLGKGVPRQQRHSTGYTSESSALLHAPYFRHAIESSVRGKYPSWWYDKEKLKNFKLPVYSDVCCSNGETKLSTAESVSFNAFQKRKRVMNLAELFWGSWVDQPVVLLRLWSNSSVFR